jgi:hypothetical protein
LPQEKISVSSSKSFIDAKVTIFCFIYKPIRANRPNQFPRTFAPSAKINRHPQWPYYTATPREGVAYLIQKKPPDTLRRLFCSSMSSYLFEPMRPVYASTPDESNGWAKNLFAASFIFALQGCGPPAL